MASGSFRSTTVNAGDGDTRYIEVTWSSENNTNTNQSTVSWNAYVRGRNHPGTTWVNGRYIIVTINGVSKTLVGGTKKELYLGKELGKGSVTVNHESNGMKGVSVSITAQIYYNYSTHYSTIYMTRNPVYTLSTSNDAGSIISTYRTHCAGIGNTGTISAGAKKLCYGDKIQIRFSPKSNYKITSGKVNGSNFTSGNTYTVNRNTSISSTSIPLKSSVHATNCNIDNNSTISIHRYNNSYTHTLTYNFKGLTGTIASKTSQTRISWTVPHIFYSKIPNDLSGKCIITCYTYNGNTCLGNSVYDNMDVYVNMDTGKPTISATVVDTNTTTKALTGNNSILIRYKSTALCTMTATPKNYSTISKLKIQNTDVNGSASGNSITAKKTISRVETPKFYFYAEDHRGINKTLTKTQTIVPYVPLTCNPSIHRTSPTSNIVELKISGNFYKASFGAKNNTLTLNYRYAEKNPNGSIGNYSTWQSISQDKIIYDTAKSKYNTETICLNNFDYKKSYKVQILAKDGSGEYVLTFVTKDLYVSQGIPVFDWSKDDFNINVPLHVSSIELEASGTNNHAGFHNSIYRGKCLGHEVTDSQYNEISNGTFKDLYIGDYWWRNGRVYRIACFNYYMGYGGSDKVTKPHVTLIPDDTIGDKVSMNDTHTTEGGYIGSKMRKTHINNAKGIIKEAFKNHVLNHRQLFTNAVSDEKPSGVVWAYGEVEIPNERMIFGNTLCSASAAVSWHAINRSLSNNQLPLFSLNPNSVACIHPYWLRDITTSASFALRDSSGYVCKYAAGHPGRVRPVFSIY